MADFNSLEKQIDTLARTMAEGFEDVYKKFESLTGEMNGRFSVVDQKLERIENNLLKQKEDILSLDTRVVKLEQPVV